MSPSQDARATMDVIWRGLLIALALSFASGWCSARVLPAFHVASIEPCYGWGVSVERVQPHADSDASVASVQVELTPYPCTWCVRITPEGNAVIHGRRLASSCDRREGRTARPSPFPKAGGASLGALFTAGVAPGRPAFGDGSCPPRSSRESVSSQALRPFDACVEPHEVSRMLYEAADLADAFRHIGSKCRTPAAIRARVRTGYMSPDDRTPRGGALWTADGLQRELLHEARLIRYFGADTSRRLQRWYAKEAVQLELPA